MARQVPGKPRRLVAAGGITPGQVAEARKDLGRHLAAWRGIAGMTQVELAKLICYSRSQIGNVEIGRESTTRRFCRAPTQRSARTEPCWPRSIRWTRSCGTSMPRKYKPANGNAGTTRRRRPSVPTAGSGVSGECGCTPMVVGRWTGREVRALREALRMSVRAFAEHLGVTTATVSRWEHRRAPAPPRPAAQAGAGSGTHARRHRLQGPVPAAPHQS